MIIFVMLLFLGGQRARERERKKQERESEREREREREKSRCFLFLPFFIDALVLLLHRQTSITSFDIQNREKVHCKVVLGRNKKKRKPETQNHTKKNHPQNSLLFSLSRPSRGAARSPSFFSLSISAFSLPLSTAPTAAALYGASSALYSSR